MARERGNARPVVARPKPPKPKPSPEPRTPSPVGSLIPPIELLTEGPGAVADPDAAQIEDMGRRLVATLETFRVGAQITNKTVGPVVTRFELEPGRGVKVGRCRRWPMISRSRCGRSRCASSPRSPEGGDRHRGPGTRRRASCTCAI